MELLQSYNKITNIMKQHGKSNKYKQSFSQLNEDEKYVIKKLRIIRNNDKQKENRAKKERVATAIETYINTSKTSEEEEEAEREKAIKIVNNMRTIIDEITNNIINK